MYGLCVGEDMVILSFSDPAVFTQTQLFSGSTDNMTVLLVSLPANVRQNKSEMATEEQLNLEIITLIDKFLEGPDLLIL